MKTLRETTDNFERALEYAKFGYRLIPIQPQSKVPTMRWKEFQTRAPTEEELRRWFSATRNNVAFVTGIDLVVTAK